MSAVDKFKNKVQDLTGKTKESTGRATGDASLESEGRTEQSKSDVKQAGEKIKDAFKR
jgi:uncharacterized protein YjbJ (UPF0337 family)